MPQNAFFLRTRDLLISPKTIQRHFLFTLHPLSTVISATATVLAFVLLRNSNFNFHCYTQREATPTQKSARKCAATSRDFFRERLQSAFTLANQLRWIAQYWTAFHRKVVYYVALRLYCSLLYPTVLFCVLLCSIAKVKLYWRCGVLCCTAMQSCAILSCTLSCCSDMCCTTKLSCTRSTMWCTMMQ